MRRGKGGKLCHDGFGLCFEIGKNVGGVLILDTFIVRRKAARMDSRATEVKRYYNTIRSGRVGKSNMLFKLKECESL
jgi:hypothetical protein